MYELTKWAVIRHSDADPEKLEHKSLTEEINKLEEEGYLVINEL